ncbi:MAG: T9SS type A sorting domain-containing protein [candidate division KSB1 bacterium]|nr:T9SS type A sorting domain-containing protein [candidate division KSB1 bacterium]MDZ7369019.1 T9SS type A sorting domain-containing protein [candidate division KSB1 bacterium]MDZ7407057.1 T9SS type A sorting domain-containing protein [candidate division KSB1 bacterium]
MKTMLRLAAAVLLASRFFLAPEVLLAQQDQVWITEINVTKPQGSSASFLVPEVHLFEAGTDSFLACASESHCQAIVNNRVTFSGYQFDVFYSVQSFFKKPNASALRFSEIANRSIYLKVFDNADTLGCPRHAPIPPDILLATSNPFPASELSPTKVMQFGHVSHLRIGNTTTRTPAPNSPLVKIKEIEVTGVTDGIGRLEIEVHLYEQGTNGFLACSGQINGLENVDFSGQLYHVDARFRRPFLGPDITYEDIKNKIVYLGIIEDDTFPCPCVTGYDDDPVARTAPFSGSELLEAKEFRNIGSLKQLSITLDGVPPRVTLLAPANLSLLNSPTLMFTWQRTGPTIVEQYQFQLASDSLMTTIVKDTTTTNTALTISARGLQQGFYWWRVRGRNANGWGLYSRRNSFVFITPTSVTSPAMTVTDFHLEQNFPNPFNPETAIKYELPKPAEVKLDIYDLQGRQVRTLVNQRQPAGRYTITWNGRNEQGEALASGVYLYQLRAGNFVQTRRMALVR